MNEADPLEPLLKATAFALILVAIFTVAWLIGQSFPTSTRPTVHHPAHSHALGANNVPYPRLAI
ncbi:hypothetical protein [Nocardia sp. NBC_00511]|uniref:hypothetical protein n=1 Tax=Nocardia sp. NBC_00511 TaxID=2903591 RepID=UPI0030E5982A